MHIRPPAVAGAFYPLGASELRAELAQALAKARARERSVIAAIAPHAGYAYCGKTAAAVYGSIAANFNTAVILGPNHFGIGAGIATSSGIWRTPLGAVSVDDEFAEQLQADSPIIEDHGAHAREHSIEVQLPWLQHRFENFKFVPICINPIYFDKGTCRRIGQKIAQVAAKLKRKVLIIASSDFSHYGAAYGWMPFKGTVSQVLKKIREIDMHVASCITRLMPEKLIEVCDERRLTVCGYGGIAATIWAAQELGAKKGKVADYSTSFDISRDASAIVGYCGIVLF
jgi:hypothetical protein